MSHCYEHGWKSDTGACPHCRPGTNHFTAEEIASLRIMIAACDEIMSGMRTRIKAFDDAIISGIKKDKIE